MNEKSISDIKGALPYQAPFLLVDRALVSDCGTEIKAVKAFSANEEFFCGHFPGQAITPGVLQVFAMMQTALLGVDLSGKTPFLREASRIKFRSPVVPGDVMLTEATITEKTDNQLSVKASTSVEGRATCQAVLVIELIEDASFFQPTGELIPPLKEDLGETLMNIEAIRGIIPHRFPFQLADRVFEQGKTEDGTPYIKGTKNVTYNEPYFSGLKMDAPFIPGPYLMEVVAQVGCIDVLSGPEAAGKIGLYMGVDRAVFYKPIVPGDRMYVYVQEDMAKAQFLKCSSKVYVGDELRAEVDFKCAIVEKEG